MSHAHIAEQVQDRKQEEVKYLLSQLHSGNYSSIYGKLLTIGLTEASTMQSLIDQVSLGHRQWQIWLGALEIAFVHLMLKLHASQAFRAVAGSAEVSSKQMAERPAIAVALRCRFCSLSHCCCTPAACQQHLL